MTDAIEHVDIDENNVTGVEEFSPYDPADDLISDEGIAYFMAEALKTDDPQLIAHALSTAARAKGMMKIAKETGLTRGQLSLSSQGENEPTLQSALSVMHALGIRLSTTVAEKAHEMT